jgi:HAD superfamily hydrolase (TIGR01458 family)
MAYTILLDLDGTLYDRGSAVPGAAMAVDALRRAGHTVRVFTNTDSQSVAELRGRLDRLGFALSPDEVFTPVIAAQRVLAQTAHSRVLVLADHTIEAELGSGAELLSPAEAGKATHVVIGDCRETLSYARLEAAFRAVRAGAHLMALQRGRYWRDADGDHVDTGAVVAAIEYATETTARTLGKPSQDFLRMAAGAATGPVWVVGDDRSTDIAMAGHGGAVPVVGGSGK